MLHFRQVLHLQLFCFWPTESHVVLPQHNLQVILLQATHFHSFPLFLQKYLTFLFTNCVLQNILQTLPKIFINNLDAGLEGIISRFASDNK